MTKTHMEDIAEFHRKFGLGYEGKPRALPKDLSDFRLGFKEEELREYRDATKVASLELSLDNPDPGIITTCLEDQLDGLVDLVYVILGTAYLHGYELRWQEAWDRVHRANMNKIRATNASQSARGSIHDVVKPQGWTKPRHNDLVEDHIHAG